MLTLLKEGERLLNDGKINEAAALFKKIMEQKLLRAEAQGYAGLARCALAEKKLPLAVELIDTIRKKYKADLDLPEIKKAVTAVDTMLAQSGPSSPEEAEWLNKIKQNPSDLDARYKLAEVFFQAGKYQLSLDQCFEIIKKEKHWQDEAARYARLMY